MRVEKTIPFLRVNGFRLHSHSSLLERFRERWVGVRRPSNIFRAGTILDGQNGFRDHLTSVGA